MNSLGPLLSPSLFRSWTRVGGQGPCWRGRPIYRQEKSNAIDSYSDTVKVEDKYNWKLSGWRWSDQGLYFAQDLFVPSLLRANPPEQQPADQSQCRRQLIDGKLSTSAVVVVLTSQYNTRLPPAFRGPDDDICIWGDSASSAAAGSSKPFQLHRS